MAHQKKILPNMAAAKEFAAKLGILIFESYTTQCDTRILLTWKTLQLVPVMGRFEAVTMGRKYDVFKETGIAYLIRDDAGKVTKVNRLTMMGGKAQFEVAD